MSEKTKPTRHPVPTAATLKELYANAYFCAFPKCKKALYKVDLENQIRTLNSTAAHICARSEHGPRWESTQSREENMSVSNLLALCREHSAEIDDKKKEHLYPATLLREWKILQLSAYDALAQGWNVPDSDIEQIQQGIEHFNNTFSNTNIDLGGKGGNAPGAGGGGGGVLGSSNSVGGNGGNGGNTINLNGQSGTAPGAGGGAHGVLGEGAIAGGGGSGGELVEAIISGHQTGQVLLIEVDKGGVDGKGGGDSLISLVRENGGLTPLLCAKGGKAGQPGRHGDLSGFARALTPADLSGGARITTLMLAEVVRVKGDLVTIVEGGWTTFSVSTLPYRMNWPLYATLHMNELVAPTVIRCVIQVKDPNKNLMFEEQFLFKKLDEQDVLAHLNLLLQFEAKEFGVWHVEIVSGDHLLATIPVHVLSIPVE